MKWKTDFTGMSFDLVGYRRALLNALRNLNERAGQAWINEVVNNTPIPTWSGASRATFQKLANELGTTVPIGPIKSSKSRVSLGKASSGGSGVYEKRGSQMFVGFIYKTSLRYLAYNEYNKATAGSPPAPFSNNVRFTPYGFQIRAEAAWQAVAATAKLPDPTRYIRKRKL
jgi:hypothetical protein